MSEGHVVVSQSGGSVGWFDGFSFVDVQANAPDAFWSVPQDHAIL